MDVESVYKSTQSIVKSYDIGSTSMGKGESVGDGGARSSGVSWLVVGGSGAVVGYFHCRKASVRDVKMAFQFDCCRSKRWHQVLVSR